MIVLLVVYAKKVDWEEVWKVIRDYNRVALLSAVGLVVVSYLIYGCYDLLARFYCGHKLAKRQVMLVSFICYAFNLTLSTWVGGIGMRYRLYSRLGLPGSTITRIFSLSITTNWLGYILLAGIIFTAGVVELPDHWYVDQNHAAHSRHWLTDDYRGLFVVLRFREAPPYDHQRTKTGAAFMEIRPRPNADFQR
ncbi:inner membrane protein [Escherichia coli]|nr:inner membrane protein [Escherichia coli]